MSCARRSGVTAQSANSGQARRAASALDPHSRSDLWEHVGRMHEELATTIVLTMLYLDEANDSPCASTRRRISASARA